LNATEQVTIQELRGPVLRGVSRSFYLSLRLLPAAVRDPLSLAYLLARATDTVADTTQARLEHRLETLSKLRAAIAGTESIADLATSFVPLQSNAAERRLIEALPAVIAWLRGVDETDGADIRDVLKKIARGQMLDLERFGGGGELRVLRNASELDEYTYLVAGCVGEFWTNLCARKLPAFSTEPQPVMIERGVAYGKGLQLTNIVRDAGADLRAGRCYLPEDELRSVGVTPAAAEPVLARWREKAEAGLAAGIAYAAALKNPRLRIATALPALIGIRTLRLLSDNSTHGLREHVKLPRAETRRIVLRTIATFASPRFLHAEFARYRK
jgi:farnesyl-diphosphate farnesyltransferase